MKRVIYLFFSGLLTVSTMLAQATLPCPPGSGPCGENVNDVLPLEQDLLMIILAVGLAVFYFKGKSFFFVKKKNS